MTPFATVTPVHTLAEPKQVFLSLHSSLGDGAEMPYAIEQSFGYEFYIYSDGQTVIDGRQTGQLSAEQMCTLEAKIDSYTGLFEERESLSKTGEIDHFGGGHIIRYKDAKIDTYGLKPESIIDEVAPGVEFITNYVPPINLQAYDTDAIVLYIASADEGSWYSWYYPEGGLTDNDIKDWPNSLPPIIDFIEERPRDETSYVDDYVLQEPYLDQIAKAFGDTLRNIHWFRDAQHIYMVIPTPLWPHDVLQTFWRSSSYINLGGYQSQLICGETPHFLDPNVPIQEPTVLPAAQSLNGYGKIALEVQSGADREIAVMNADGSTRLLLTNNLVDDMDPTWSPDGRTIAFNSGNGDKARIYLMDEDGNNRRPLFDNLPNYHPSWSPTGDMIAFSGEDGSGWKSAQIKVSDLAGNVLFELGDPEVPDTYPAWSPDGTMLAYTRRVNSDNLKLIVQRIDGRTVRSIASGYASFDTQRYAWAPDSQHLAVATGAGRGSLSNTVQLLNVFTGETEDVVSVGYVYSLNWTNDGRALLIAAREPNTDHITAGFARGDVELYLFNLNTNVLTQITYNDVRELSADIYP